MIKKTIMAAIAVSVFAGGIMTSKVSAEPGKDLRIIPIIVKGQKVRFPDTEPYMNTDGRTMVPVRFVSEMLGAEVTWENSTQTAIIQYEGKTIRMPIGSKTVTVDGEDQELDTAAEKYDGRTMVPLRFVSEVLDSTVEWDAGAHSVKVTDAKYQAKVDAGEVKLNPWGREYTDKFYGGWMNLKDLESFGFYEVDYKEADNSSYVETIKGWDFKTYADQWADHIRSYYAVQLNVDYRTINEKSFTDELLKHLYIQSSYQQYQVEDMISEYVAWVKKNKVITKGYADPEISQVQRVGAFPLVRVYFKFMIVSATDTSQTFLDNWNVSQKSEAIHLDKGVWYGGYSTVHFDTTYANNQYLGYVIADSENMFTKRNYKYDKLK